MKKILMIAIFLLVNVIAISESYADTITGTVRYIDVGSPESNRIRVEIRKPGKSYNSHVYFSTGSIAALTYLEIFTTALVEELDVKVGYSYSGSSRWIQGSGSFVEFKHWNESWN